MMTIIKIRPATREDIPAVLQLICELNELEKISLNNRDLTVERMTRDGFPPEGCSDQDEFRNFPLFRCFVAEEELHKADQRQSENSIVGFTLFYPVYRMPHGRCVCMEDLYVSPQRRGSGVGFRLWAAVADWAIRFSVLVSQELKMFFTVLGWNKEAIQFYHKYGARDTTASGGRLCYRIFQLDTLTSLLEEKKNRIRPATGSMFGQ